MISECCKHIPAAIIILTSFFLFLPAPALTSPGETAGPFELSPEEEFLFTKQEIVISAAKYQQEIRQAPATIYVVTAEDIRQSGLTSIPDILRIVPGLEVLTVSSTQSEVNARGFNKAPSNKMVVMIDGLSFFENAYNQVNWNALPVILDEIKQIEVILGPSSALYGANAFSGLIHIITKSPEESETLHLINSGGLENTSSIFSQYTSLLHGGKKGKTSWKFAAGHKEKDRWSDEEKTERTSKVGGELRYNYSESLHFRLFGNYVTSNSESLVEDAELDTDSYIDRYNIGLSFQWHQLELITNYLNSNYNSRDISLFSLSPSELSQLVALPASSSSFGSNYDYFGQLDEPYDYYTIDIQAQYILDPVRWVKLSIGSTYHHNAFEWQGLTAPSNVNEYAAFLQGVFLPFKALSITLGGRFDHYKTAGDNWSYRGSLIYSLQEDHHLRLSFGKAFRNPSLLENFMDVNMVVPLPGGDPPSPFLFPINISGDPDLNPESIYTTELAYQILLMQNRLRFQLIGFYSELKDLINLSSEFISVQTNLPAYPLPITISMPTLVKFDNINEALALGGEMSLHMQWNKKISSFINYSLEHTEYTRGIKEGRRIKNTPAHKVNCGLRLAFENGLSANITGHFVSPTVWEEAWIPSAISAVLLNRIIGCRIDGYFLLNARLAYAFYNNRAEVAVTGYNLLADKHREHPLGDEIGSRLFFSLQLDF